MALALKLSGCSRRGVALVFAAVLEGFPLFPVVKHLAGRAALEFADDAVFGHEVDEPGRPAVADSERPLQAASTSRGLRG